MNVLSKVLLQVLHSMTMLACSYFDPCTSLGDAESLSFVLSLCDSRVLLLVKKGFTMVPCYESSERPDVHIN